MLSAERWDREVTAQALRLHVFALVGEGSGHGECLIVSIVFVLRLTFARELRKHCCSACYKTSSSPLSALPSTLYMLVELLCRLGKESETKRRKEEKKERAQKKAARDAQHEVMTLNQ